jgi:hypothetical protein
LHRAIEVDDDTIPDSIGILLREGKDESVGFLDSRSFGLDERASFWLTKVHDVDGKREVLVVLRRIPPQKFRHLNR